MFNKKIKEETDLLLEQERFMKNRCGGKMVSVFNSPKDHPPVSKQNPEDMIQSQHLLSENFPSVFLEVKERMYEPMEEDPIEKEIISIPTASSFPVASYRTISDVSSNEDKPISCKRKSIFAREMDRLRPDRINNNSESNGNKRGEDSLLEDCLTYLQQHGPQTITGSGLGCRSQEAIKIHRENLERLRNLSEYQIMMEREEILSSVDPGVITFLLHKDRNILGAAQKLKSGLEKTSERKNVASQSPSVLSDGYPLKPNPKIPHMDTLEPEKLAWTLDLPDVAKRPPTVNLFNDETSSEMEPDGTTISKSSAPCQARFDLRGFVIPPEAIVDMHLGLHHHGEEPERAGYTVGELFHLARSSVPAQRRLALASLAASLAQSRRGRHVPHLAPFHAPSLIYGLLTAPELSAESIEGDSGDGGGGGGGGVAFLLRWCLDEAVSALTSVGTAAAGVRDTGTAAGISLGLLIECIRGFANLLCDSIGEAYLARSSVWSFDWLSSSFLAPSVSKSKSKKPLPGVTFRAPEPESEKDVDHAKAMCRDPIALLFTHSQLARRLAWLLADGPGRPRARLSADAVGLWLPALLIRGVRHSAGLAYKIFSTPELFATLRDNFLLELKPHKKHGIFNPRPSVLSDAYNLPLPTVLQLCRITMMSSPSIRLAMVNDMHIVERCLSYVSCPDCLRTATVPSIESLIAHLPEQLPTRLAFQLQIESLRCLTACLGPFHPDMSNFAPILALNLIRKHGSTLISSGHHCYTVYQALCNSQEPRFTEESDINGHLVTALLTAWLSFISVALEQLANKPELSSQPDPPPTEIAQWIDQIGTVTVQILHHTRQVLQGQGNLPSLDDLEPLLQRNRLSLDLVAVAMTCTVKLVALQYHLDVSVKLPIQERLITLWNEHFGPLLQLRLWPLLLERFQCNESVLTGSPATLADVDIVTIPVWNVNADTKDEAVTNPVDWTSLSTTSPIDTSLLEPVTVVSDNVPDLGTAVCFRYRVSERNLGCFWWPKYGIATSAAKSDLSQTLDECDPLAVDLVLQVFRIQPLMAALVTCMQFFLLRWRFHLAQTASVSTIVYALRPIVDWIRRLATKPLFPWFNGSSRKRMPLPHWLVAMECQLAGEALLLCAQLITQHSAMTDQLITTLCHSSAGNLVHRATLRLLPQLRANQYKLLNRLLTEIVFPVHQLELAPNPSGLSILTPHLPQVIKLFRRELTAWYHRNNKNPLTTESSLENCSNLNTIPESMDESESVSTVASSSSQVPIIQDQDRSSRATIVDSLLPQDWAYLPLVCQYARIKLQSSSNSSLSPTQGETEVILHELTNGLRWLFYLVQRDLPDNRTVITAGLLDPLSHFVRLCVGCLAYPGAGGLGFGDSGYLLAQLIARLEPISRLHNRPIPVRTLEQVNLPEHCASFYDVYMDLLGHYAALSYNSPVFANLILWPCQQLCHMKYRRALWGEHLNALVAVRLRCDQLLFPLSSLLEPEETEETVLRGYAVALISGVIRVDRHPLLFLIAVHHLNRFLYTSANASSEFTKQFVRLPQITPVSRGSSVGLCGTRADLLDLIRRYRQPRSTWLHAKTQLLDLGGKQLSPDQALVSLPPMLTEVATTFWEHCTLAGLECYEENQMPAHRQAHWNRFLTSV